MELVKGLKEKYNNSPTQEEVKEVLDNADTGSTTPETIRNLVIDIGSGAALAGLGAAGAKAFSKATARSATKEALNSLKNGVDDSLGHQTSLIKKAASKESEINKLMKQNKAAAKSVAEGGNGKKALTTVVKNSKREAEIGPRFIDDIQEILLNDTGLSEKEVKKAINDFIKENADNVELITLIEAKEPIATYSHSRGVKDLVYKLAKKAELDDKKAKQLADAALVHDIGKVQVPDYIISSKARFDKYSDFKKRMNNHDVVGGEILSSDPYKAHIAAEHHPNGRISGSNDAGLVTTADIYEAMTSDKRSYKPGLSVDEAFTELGKKVDNGDIKGEHLDLLKKLRDDESLPERYDYTSPLESPYNSMKANEIKRQVASDYENAAFKDAFLQGLPRAVSGGIALGGVTPSGLPTLSEILEEYSDVFPTFKPKAEKLEYIRHWFNNGYTNDEINNLIVNTDFTSNRQVTKLWKLMKAEVDKQEEQQ